MSRQRLEDDNQEICRQLYLLARDKDGNIKSFLNDNVPRCMENYCDNDKFREIIRSDSSYETILNSLCRHGNIVGAEFFVQCLGASFYVESDQRYLFEYLGRINSSGFTAVKNAKARARGQWLTTEKRAKWNELADKIENLNAQIGCGLSIFNESRCHGDMTRSTAQSAGGYQGDFSRDSWGKSVASAATMSVSGASRDPRLAVQGAASAAEARPSVEVAAEAGYSNSLSDPRPTSSSAKRPFDADHGTPTGKRGRLDSEAKDQEYAGKYQLELDERKGLEKRHSKLKEMFYAKEGDNIWLEERVSFLEGEVEKKDRGNAELKKSMAQSQHSFSSERQAMSLKMTAVESALRKSNDKVKRQSAKVDGLTRRQKQYKDYLLEIIGQPFSFAGPQEPKMPEEDGWMMCPISHMVMQDPVTIETGHTYEKVKIEEWFAKNKACPMTGEEVGRRDNLKVVVALRDAIQSKQSDPSVRGKCLLYQEQKNNMILV